MLPDRETGRADGPIPLTQPSGPAVQQDEARRNSRVSLAGTLFLVIVALTAWTAGIVVFLVHGIDGNRVARLLKPRIEAAAGLKISFSGARLSWTSAGRPRLTVNNLGIREVAEGAVYVYSPVATFDANLIPLLKGTVAIDRVYFSNPALVITPSASSRPHGSVGGMVGPASNLPIGRQDVYPARQVQSGESPHVGSFPRFQVTVGSLEVENGRVLATPPAPGAPDRTLFDRVNLHIRGITRCGVEGFAVAGTAEGSTSSGPFDVVCRGIRFDTIMEQGPSDLGMRLSHCPIRPFRQLAACLGYEVPFSAGRIDLDLSSKDKTSKTIFTGNLEIAEAVLAPGHLLAGEVSMGRCGSKFSIEREPGSMRLRMEELYLPGLTAELETTARGLSSHDPFLTVSVKQAALDLARLFPLFPLNLLTTEDRHRLMATGLAGSIVVTGGSWNGRLSDLRDARNWQKALVLDVLLDQVSGFLPGVGLRVHDAKGRIRLTADEAGFQNVSLTLGNSPIVVKGWVRDLRGSAVGDLYLSIETDGADLQAILETRAIGERLPLWLRRMTQPTGGISAVLDVKGALSKPAVNGHIVLDRFKCGLKGSPVGLSETQGRLTFQGAGVSLSEVRGSLGESRFQVSGSLTPASLDVLLDLQVPAKDLRRICPFPAGWTYSGKLPISASVKGPLTDPSFSGIVDFTKNALHIGPWVGKKPGVGLMVRVSGSKGPKTLRIDEVGLESGNAAITGKGTVEESGRLDFAVNLPPRGLETDFLRGIAHPGLNLQAGGRIEGDMVLKAGPGWLEDPKIRADLRLNHVSLNVPGFHRPFYGVTGDLQWRGKTVNWAVTRGKFGNSEFAGSWSVNGFENPKVECLVDLAFLDTADLASPPEQASQFTWPEWIRSNAGIKFLARSALKAVVKIAKCKTSDRTFSDFRATFEGTGGLLNVASWEAKMAAEAKMDYRNLWGSAELDIRADTKKPLTIDFEAEEMAIERVLLSDPEKMSIDGKLGAKGKLEWKTSGGRENGGLTKSGNVAVKVADGKIHRFDILSKIFTVVNLGSIFRFRLPDVVSQGLPYQRLTWDMDIFDNKWQFENLRLESDAARIDAVGMYFSDQNKIDFKVSVCPLVGIDKLLSGVFGNLLTKDGRTLCATFRVRGLYASPDVRLEAVDPFRSD